MKLFDLSGKTAIVTGGNRGLGLGMTEGLLKAGAKVCIIASSDRVFAAVDELSQQDYDVIGLKCDLFDEKQTETVFHQAVSNLGGKLDILINNAGVQRRHPAEQFPLSDWDDVLNVNLRVVFQLCQLAANHMIPNGGGKIINIASLLTFFGGITVPAYAASKGGVGQLTRALSNEWASKGINVNAIAPGYMETDMNEKLIEDKEVRYKEISARIPQGRWGTAEDMMGTAIFLASAASDYLNGTIIPVDGGYIGR